MNLKKIIKNKDWTLFLDRDGVINVKLENDYVKTAEEFIFTPKAPEAIAFLNKIFKHTFIVTNQQGIGKGLMSTVALEQVHKYMEAELEKAGAYIDKIYFCPNKIQDNSFYRKPNIGMALAAKKANRNILFKQSVMVGDSITDMQFGKKLKMTTVFISPTSDEAKKYHKLIDLHFDSLKSFADYLS